MEENCKTALTVDGGTFDEVYQLAADMGGMGFIHSAETEIMHNSVLINIYMTDWAARLGVPRYFFSSSVCVYRDMKPGEPEMTEAEAIPAHPDNEYGWEKLYSERVAMAYERRYGMQVRIARFQNCYGPEGTWTGGREKAPAAMCRKVAEAEDGGVDRSVGRWHGDPIVHLRRRHGGRHLSADALRSARRGQHRLPAVRHAWTSSPTEVIKQSGKKFTIKHVPGPVGVQSRNFSNERIYSLGWQAKVFLEDGIRLTYPWVAEQVKAKQAVPA